jgi:ParB family chromosome partitioning protein
MPIMIRELDDLAVLEIGIIENVQRADLNASKRR